MKKNIGRLTVLGLLTTAAFAQIEQTHPELCGRDEANAPALPPISVSVDRTQGSATLFFRDGGAEQAIDLPGVVDSVPEACPLADGRYLIFGETYNGTNLLIIDSNKHAVIDHFQGFDPALSPNQRWIVYRKFYPREHDLSVSEEYLIYDLSKTPTQNRPPSIEVTDWEDVGRAIFPLGRANTFMDAMDSPADRTHVTGSKSFAWSSDSRLVVFGDRLQGRFAVVAMVMSNDGLTKAYEHPITISEVCGSGPVSNDFRVFMSRATIAQSPQGDYSIQAGFEPVPGGCVPKPVELRWPGDFAAAIVEKPFEHHYQRKAAVVDQ